MKVISKQYNSSMCIVCGVKNSLGIHADFYNLEDGSVGTEFAFQDVHQSYPNRVHGGVVSAMLDELAGRALWCENETQFAVTATMSIKFRKPVPYGVKLKGHGYITKRMKTAYLAKSEIYDENNVLLAELSGTYFILPTSAIVQDDNFDVDELNVMTEGNLSNISFE
ncbi:MAG: PaaI family thioesterase [Clostridia bacterium]